MGTKSKKEYYMNINEILFPKMCECKTCWDDNVFEVGEWEVVDDFRRDHDANHDLYIILTDHYVEEDWVEVLLTTSRLMVVRDWSRDE